MFYRIIHSKERTYNSLIFMRGRLYQGGKLNIMNFHIVTEYTIFPPI